MNSKKAKRLRKLARQQVPQDVREYESHNGHPVNVRIGTDKVGKPIIVRMWYETLQLAKGCQRWVYKQLKKGEMQ